MASILQVIAKRQCEKLVESLTGRTHAETLLEIYAAIAASLVTTKTLLATEQWRHTRSSPAKEKQKQMIMPNIIEIF